MHLKLMADYGCWPLWKDGPGDIGNVDPRTLPISEELAASLDAWAQKLDQSLDWDDPAGTQWPEGFWADFNGEGRLLAARLRGELGSDFHIREQLWGD